MPDRFRDIRDRFVKGRLISSGDSDKFHFDAVGAPPGVDNIRVIREDFPKTQNLKGLRPGDDLDLFLLRPTEHDSRMWYGHAAWAEQGGASNPWIHAPPHPGDVVRGTVTAYIQDYACMVRLDESGIEAFLHRDHLPDPPDGRAALLPITRQVFLGDRVEAEIIEVRPLQLQLRLSVTERLRAVRERFARNPPGTRIELPTTAGAESGHSEHPGSTRRILLIENDEVLASSLQALARHEGWHCDWARNEESTRQVLRQGQKYDAVLLDHHLQLRGQRLLCEKLMTGQRVALMSGDRDAAKHAREKKYSWLPKPVHWDLLYRFVQGENLPADERHLEEDQGRWGGGAAMTRQVERQYALLERLRKAIGAIAVLWLLHERKDVYYLAARAGFQQAAQEDLDRLEALWSQTVIAGAHAQPETPHELLVAASGPLKTVAPAGATHIVAIAGNLPREDGRERRGGSILVFFRDKAWLAADHDRLALALWATEDLADRLEIARRLEEQEAFATEGRLTAGLIHEVAQSLGLLIAPLQDLEVRMKKGLPADPTARREEVDRLGLALRQAKRASWLAKNSLTTIQNERPPLYSIPGDLDSYCKTLTFVAGRRDLPLHHDLSCLPTIRLRLPPAVIEQTLVNLLDHAVHHMAGRTWGSVSIDARWEDNHPLPLVIDFTDTGRGMTAEARSHLFEPRKSRRGRSGFGMGLYVSRNLLESIGGTLECAESLRWLGSRFRLRLPCHLADKKA